MKPRGPPASNPHPDSATLVGVDQLIVQLSQPVSWLKLGFTLLVGYAVWRVVAALLSLVTPSIHRNIALVARTVWLLVAVYSTLAAAVHALGLIDVPLLYTNNFTRIRQSKMDNRLIQFDSTTLLRQVKALKIISKLFFQQEIIVGRL